MIIRRMSAIVFGPPSASSRSRRILRARSLLFRGVHNEFADQIILGPEVIVKRGAVSGARLRHDVAYGNAVDPMDGKEAHRRRFQPLPRSVLLRSGRPRGNPFERALFLMEFFVCCCTSKISCSFADQQSRLFFTDTEAASVRRHKRRDATGNSIDQRASPPLISRTCPVM